MANFGVASGFEECFIGFNYLGRLLNSRAETSMGLLAASLSSRPQGA